MKITKAYILFVFVFVLGTICAGHTAAQAPLTLSAVGNGERVRLAAGGKSKVVTLEGTSLGDFTAGGEPPHRYTTLLSVRAGNAFYLVAKFRSGPTLSRNGPCGGDNPSTLLMIKTDKNLRVENIQSEIYDSCIYNGSGRYIQGKPQITKNRVSISFDEGSKKYRLFFDANEADKGLQVVNR